MLRKPIYPTLAVWLLIILASNGLTAQETWEFNPARDTFDEGALLDLRYLNEEVAGQNGWVTTTPDGGFQLGNGDSVRFWAVGSGVDETDPRDPRPRPGWDKQSHEHHARWLAKRGVNMVRIHSFIKPSTEKAITEVDEAEVEWIWRTIGAMKAEGIYSTLSPYWAVDMRSDDGAWGTDWQGEHHGLLFFDETLQNAYKEWLRYLFTTPTPHLGGKTLAEEPALAIFQVQNEDSLLFWTVNAMPAGPKARLGKLFGDFAKEKYGSLDSAYENWNNEYANLDNIPEGILGFANLWDLTGAANRFDSLRLADQHQFWTELMRDFYGEIADFVRNELGCPVLTNGSNWKTADTVYLNDSERYSYTSTDVQAVNRYFTGIHQSPTGNQGWAILADDFYTQKSVLGSGALDLPVNLKQVTGQPMMVTESTWVFPNENGYESPLLLASYMSLSGVDVYYWFSSGTDDFERPRSANGYLENSQAKWLCMTPDMAGQWPAAALAFRKGYIQQGDPVVQEHRSLQSMWERRSPIIAETASFDPNRDSGNLPPDTPVTSGVTPWAYFAGPVQVTYDSNEANTFVSEELSELIEEQESGVIVRSNTQELELNTATKFFKVDAPRIQGIVTEEPIDVQLSNVRITCDKGRSAITIASLDGLPLPGARRVLVQVGSHTRPSGWQSREGSRVVDNATQDGFIIEHVGQAPWAVQTHAIELHFSDMNIFSAQSLDMNGLPGPSIELSQADGLTTLTIPPNTMYVLVEAEGLDFSSWQGLQDWEDPESDAGENADPEADGLTNFLEYAFATNPLDSDSEHFPRPSILVEEGQRFFTLVYRENLQSKDMMIEIETSTDMANWNPLAVDDLTNIQTTLDPDVENQGEVRLIEFKSLLTDSVTTTTFFRLKVRDDADS